MALVVVFLLLAIVVIASAALAPARWRPALSLEGARHDRLADQTYAAESVLDARLFYSALKNVSPRHVDAARREAVSFEFDYQRSFRAGAAHSGAELVRLLFARRAQVLEALREIRMRLPNDLRLERMAVGAIEESDRRMLEHIEDVRVRCGVPMLHPGPVDDAWYGRWYRAANDVVS